MDWTGVGAVAALVTSLGGLGMGVTSLVKSARESGAKQRAVDADISARAVNMSMGVMERTITQLTDTCTRQEGKIGVLEGEIKSYSKELQTCHDERDSLLQRVSALENKAG